MRTTPLAAALVSAAALLSSASASAEPARFALSMMHFNLQYVAGGLWGYPLGDKDHPMDDRTVEDRIIEQSFEPVLDLYAKHPGWGADIELQGYMLEVLEQRHPAVLDKLRQLSQSGQIEVVSFHYSDQLYIAYPHEDWERSARRNRAVFDRLGIPLGKAVFCQEGQAGPGLAAAMKAHGYETLVFPKNLFGFQHEGVQAEPLYRFGDVSLITYNGVTYPAESPVVQTSWTFVDDGELLAVEGKLNPYFGDAFVKSDAAVAKHESEVSALEQQGFAVTTVSKYVSALKGLVEAKDPPPLLDGTWQPGSTDGTFRWLGGKGLMFKDERDADARAVGALAHRELMAAEAAAAAASIDASDELSSAERLMLLGQVSDATGVNPFRGEVEYTLAHEAESVRIAREVIVRARETLGAKELSIDTDTGEVKVDPPPDPPLDTADLPFSLDIKSGDRPASIESRQAGPGHLVVAVTFPPGETRSLEVKFPGEMGDIVYTPALSDAPAHAPRAAFTFKYFDLALSDGLIGLSASRFVVKDQAMAHVGARVTPGSGDVVFHDDTSPAGESTTWVFHLVDGDEATAAKVARGVNVAPRVRR